MRMLSAVQISTGFSSQMSFAQRVENVITYVVVGLIDWVAFHRCVALPCILPVSATVIAPSRDVQYAHDGWLAILSCLTSTSAKSSDSHQTVFRQDRLAEFENMIGMAGRSVYLPLSIKHGIDLGSKEALRRGVMHLFNIDFALEWPRALPPNVKLVGPLMPEPAKPLPTDLQVHYPAPC